MKKIGVVINTSDEYRQGEAVRVALGLTLMDDHVELIVLDNLLKRTEAVEKNLELLGMMKGKAYSNNPDNGLETLSIEEISRKLLEYDVVVPY
jgi:hypothetical protein